MVRIITVEREYGSRGGEFAHLLADYLGWRLIDKCIVDEIAGKIGLDKRMVANCDERLDPWYYRLGKTFWHASVERMPAIMSSSEVFDSERLTSLIRDYLKDRVAEGRCVVVGRGAASALINVPGTFHVFVYASTARKLAWFRDQFPDRAADAQQELEATDNRRAELHPALLQPGLERPPALPAHAELLHGLSGDDWRDDGSGGTGAQRQRDSGRASVEEFHLCKRRGRTMRSALSIRSLCLAAVSVSTAVMTATLMSAATAAVRLLRLGCLVRLLRLRMLVHLRAGLRMIRLRLAALIRLRLRVFVHLRARLRRYV